MLLQPPRGIFQMGIVVAGIGIAVAPEGSLILET
jgi:hypothetical protein